MRPPVRAAVSVVALALALAIAAVAPAQPAAAPTTQATRPIPDQAALEKQFEETMSGSVLVGRFTDTSKPDARAREERYVIQRVSKIAAPDGDGDRWLFICRIQFGRNDVAVPLTIPVKWAGDTAVISVTDMTIPSLGTYNARVLIDRDHYTGTWRGDKHGGHLWGRIERAGTTRPATAATPGTTTRPAP